MDTTKTLDALNDSRKTTPGVYVWGKFTPDTEHYGFQELPLLDAPSSNATVAVDNGGGELTQVKLGTIATLASSTVAESLAPNFNLIGEDSMYYYVESVKDETTNCPENVTAGWFIQVLKHDTTIMQIATRVDNPRSHYFRTRVEGNWTSWVFSYGSYHE